MTTLVVLCVNFSAYGAGVWKVAGSGFDQSVRGNPIVWRNGIVHYRTDQGDLNASVRGNDADAAIAWAFAQWTDVPTAAAAAVRDGQLGEDVNSSNVGAANGALQLPPDAQASGNERLIVVYDNGGAITDALLGAGASSPLACSTNATVSYVDQYASDGHFSHAVLVLNGNCFTSTAQLRYVLVRALGQILGVGWSQLNDNIVTGIPAATTADFAGWPRMHPLEGWCAAHCSYDSTLRPDDVAAISRLYPVTKANASQWPGKTLFRETTARVSGRVLFANGVGMNGVNVVARLLDPNTNQPSPIAAVSCVSGFLFRGNAGNPVTGYAGANGLRYDRFGGDDPALAGYYEIAGLPVPATTARYRISVEPVNPLYTGNLVVGPYDAMSVSPSGNFAAAIVDSISAGGDVTLDVSMQGSSAGPVFGSKASRWTQPLSVPSSGVWVSSMAAPGQTDYLSFLVRKNRSFTVEVTALDEAKHATQYKLAPVVGVWNASDPAGAPAAVMEGPFNATLPGISHLFAATSGDDVVTLGVADLRGDARPDYAYLGRILYAEDVQPSRVASGQGSITISGRGFTPQSTLWIGNTQAAVRSVNATRMVAAVPDISDGRYDVEVRDTLTGAVADMYHALQVGDPAASIVLASQISNATAAVGAISPQLLRVRVTASDGSPLAGEAVTFQVSPAASVLTACGGNPCTVLTNQAGEAQTGVLIGAVGANTVTATLRNGNAVSATFQGAQMAYSVTALVPEQWVAVASGSAAALLLPAKLVHNGNPVANVPLVFSSTDGALRRRWPRAPTRTALPPCSWR